MSWRWGAVLLICVGAGAVGTFALIRDTSRGTSSSSSQLSGSNGPPGPTVAHPLAPTATQVSLAHATATFGSPIALPNTSAVQPSDLGPVWEISTPGGTWVAVTFPSKGVFIQYGRPAPPDPASYFRETAAAFPGTHLVQLNGTTPGVYMQGNDGSGTNVVDFENNGADVRVFGKDDEATLEAMAQSILTQLTS